MAWKSVLILCTALVAGVHGAAKVLTPKESADILQLYEQHCNSNKDVRQQRQPAQTIYHCETSDHVRTINVTHNKTLDSSKSGGSENITHTVFVKPPKVKYNHKIFINGVNGDQGQAHVFIIPQQVDHQFDVVDNRSNGDSVPPKIHFVSNEDHPVSTTTTVEADESMPSPPDDGYPDIPPNLTPAPANYQRPSPGFGPLRRP